MKDAARLVYEIESATVAACVAGHTVTTVYYVLRKHLGSQKAMLAISNMLRLFEVVPVEKADFFQASTLGIPDFEDAVCGFSEICRGFSLNSGVARDGV